MFSNHENLQFATDSLFPIMFVINMIYGVIFWLIFKKDNLISVNYWVRGCIVFAVGSLFIASRFYMPFYLGWAIGPAAIFY